MVDWIVRGQTNSYKTQSSYITDILKLKSGALKYFYEETEETEEHEWQGLAAEEVDEQLNALGLSIDDKINGEILIVSKNKSTKGEVSHEQNEDGSFDIKVKLKVTRQEIKIVFLSKG